MPVGVFVGVCQLALCVRVSGMSIFMCVSLCVFVSVKAEFVHI